MKFKNENNKKKILSLVLTSIFTLSLLLLTLISFYPRNLSFYIKDDISQLEKFEIVNKGELFEFNINEDINFFNDILNVDVVPVYFLNKKVTTSYRITLYYEKHIYVINGYRIIILDSITENKIKIHNFNNINYSLYSVIQKYIGG